MPEVLQANNVKYKCAQIHCCIKQNFSICCNYCDLTTNDFDQFSKHFLELHFGPIEQNELIEILEEDFNADERNKGHFAKIIEDENEKEKIGNSNDFITRIEIEFNVSPIAKATENKETVNNELAKREEDVVHEKKLRNDQSDSAVNKILNNKFEAKIKVRDFQTLAASGESANHGNKKETNNINEMAIDDHHSSSIESDSLPTGRFMCKHCYKSFTNKVNRNLHQLRHTEIPKFRCIVCEKDFYTQFELRNHMRYHKNELAYVCEKCGKAFRHSWVLKKHSRTHASKSRTLPCPVCGKLFAYNDNLLNHMQTHNTVAKFACQECPRTFTQSKLLWAHKKRYHSNSEWKNEQSKNK